jgi:hypothetical protein
VFFAATRFNPVTATNCQSSFDSLIFAVGAGSGNAVYDLDMNNIIDSSDLSKQLTGKRVNAVTVAFGQVVVDQGLAAQNPPPPPAPPTTQPQTTATQVFLKSASGGGSPICR